MDESEKIANAYLQHLGLHNIIFEPDGNVPPDFLIDGKIAVEVRRLNQNEFTATGHRGFEEIAVPLWMAVRKLLNSLGPPKSDQSWFVGYTFKRPLAPRRRILDELEEKLEAFRNSFPNREYRSISIGGNFKVHLHPATDSHATFFVPAGYSDRDSGGFVLPETRKNLLICIDDKTQAIGPYRHKYPEWWLVLIDRIGYGVAESDRDMFRAHLNVEHDWNKVILLNPFDINRAFEIP